MLLEEQPLDRLPRFEGLSRRSRLTKERETHQPVFREGKLVEIAGTEEMFAAPRHEYTRSLVAAVPVVTQEEEALRKALAEQAESYAAA